MTKFEFVIVIFLLISIMLLWDAGAYKPDTGLSEVVPTPTNAPEETCYNDRVSCPFHLFIPAVFK